MTVFGVSDFLAAALQLTVPSYALRLVRRFGARQVGWFIAMAFASLALLYLVTPLKLFGADAASGTTVHLVFIAASGLLLIGMGHLETLCSGHRQAEREEQERRRLWEVEAKEQSASLARTNERLVVELARREQKEKALRESEAQYRFLFAENPLPMLLFELKSCRFLAVNQAALRQYRFAREELMALTARDLLPAEGVQAFLRDMVKPCAGAEARGTWRHCRKDSTQFEVEITAVDLRFADCAARLLVATDVTLQRQRSQQAQEAQKTEALRQIAGGVTHHFNNILAVIDDQVSVLRLKSADAALAEPLERISAATHRGATLTRQLQAANAQQPIEPKALDLNGLIRKLTPAFRRLAGGHIVIQNTFGAGLRPIRADVRTVEEVITELVLNALGAMPAGGTLNLSTAIVHLDGVQARQHPGARAGEFVRLAVRDTGCGMTPEVQARLFEPFFTTRQGSQGAGLGLAAVLGALKQHGGWLEFTTQPGAGTEFSVFFPCAPAEESRATPTAFGETILLVEGNERARAVARFFLNRQGYRVIEADSADTALTLWDGQGAKVDLLLADLRLSGSISGRVLAEKLQQTKPTLKVVFTADVNPDENGEPPPPVEGVSFIPKPFTPDGLLETVQNCLAGQS